ncbi:MAG: lipopolysaccharide biosynthesis protein [Bacteroidota bacterium]
MGSEFWKQALTLFSGSLLAQTISIAFLPILSRLYVPEAFGIYGVFVAAVAVLVVGINGGYELTIMLPEKEEEARSLLRISLRVAHIISLILLLLLFLFGSDLLEMAHLTELHNWHLFLALSIWMEGLIQAYGFALNRMKAYRALSIAKLTRSVLTVGISTLLAFSKANFEGLLLGFLAGQAGMMCYSLLYFQQKSEKLASKSSKEARDVARKYADFPTYSVPGTLLNVASKHLPFFLLPRLFSTHINGQFSKADRVLNLPAVLVSMSIGRVFFEQASRANEQSEEALAKLTRDTFLRLFLLAIPFLLIVMLWAPDLFAWVLGEPWRLAGEYARCLMPWMFMVFIASPLSYLIDIKRKLRLFLYLNLFLFLVRLLAMLWGAEQFDDMGTLWAFGLSGAFMVFLQSLYLLYLGGVWGRR